MENLLREVKKLGSNLILCRKKSEEGSQYDTIIEHTVVIIIRRFGQI